LVKFVKRVVISESNLAFGWRRLRRESGFSFITSRGRIAILGKMVAVETSKEG